MKYYLLDKGIWNKVCYSNYSVYIYNNKIEIEKEQKLYLIIYESNVENVLFLSDEICVLTNSAGKIIIVNLNTQKKTYKYTYIQDCRCFKRDKYNIIYPCKYKNKTYIKAYNILSGKSSEIAKLSSNIIFCDDSDKEIGIFAVANNTVEFLLINKKTLNFEYIYPFESSEFYEQIDFFPLSYDFSNKIFTAPYNYLNMSGANNIVFVKDNTIQDIEFINSSECISDIFWFNNGLYFAVVLQDRINIINTKTREVEFLQEGKILCVTHSYSNSYISINFVDKTVILCDS